MKRQIRTGVFETNSSSSHVIVVTKEDKMLTKDDFYSSWKNREDGKEYLYIAEDGKYYNYKLSNGFGRSPFKLLTSFEDKMLYALSEYCYVYRRDFNEKEKAKFEEIQSILKEVAPQLTEIEIPTETFPIYLDENGKEVSYDRVEYEKNKDTKTTTLYYKKDGRKLLVHKSEEFEYEFPDIGMIDHQSWGLLDSFLTKNNISLREFLLNKKYIVVIDGDEYDRWEQLKSTPFFNSLAIESEFGIGNIK